MKRVGIVLEDSLHKEAKIRAVTKDMSFTQYITELIQKDLETRKEQSR